MLKSYRMAKTNTVDIKAIPTNANNAQWLIFLFNIASTMRFNLSFAICVSNDIQ